MAEHSRIVGGSTASRVLHCPGSVTILDNMQGQLDQAADELLASALTMPPEAAKVQEQKAIDLRGSLNRSSSYADEGTALHSVMEYLVALDDVLDDKAVTCDAEVSRIFTENEIDYDRMVDAVLPAYQQFNAFMDEVLAEDGDEFQLRVESRVTFPDIDDAFGTCDVLIRTSKRTIVWDWKFGAGVPVDASYSITRATPGREPDDPPTEEETETFGNDQLTYYAVAALHTHPDYFKDDPDWPVELVICQPRVRDNLSTYTSTLYDMYDFKLDLVSAVEEALSGSATYKLGKWCKFAACNSQCPLRADTPVGLERLASKLGALKAAAEPYPPQENAHVTMHEGRLVNYAETLGLMLDLGEIIEPYLSEAAKQAYAFMEAGGRIPGYKLVPKKAGHDKWQEEEKVDAFLGRQGLSLDERRVTKPITPAAARTLFKSKGKDMKDGSKDRKLLEKYVQPGTSSGATIAKSDDPRPEYVSTSAAVEEIAAKLKQSGLQ